MIVMLDGWILLGVAVYCLYLLGSAILKGLWKLAGKLSGCDDNDIDFDDDDDY